MRHRIQTRGRARRRLVRAAMAGFAVLALGVGGNWLQATMSAQSSERGRSREENVQKLTGKLFRVDPRTGQARPATEREARETVDQLAAVLTPQDVRGPVQGGDGTLMIELGNAANRTVIARPNAGGRFETRCVTSLDEAVDFLSGDLAADDER